METCDSCLYSSLSSLNLFDMELLKCNNVNSPYFDEIVDNSTSCRLYVDYNKYIKLKDRKESILKIKNKK